MYTYTYKYTYIFIPDGFLNTYIYYQLENKRKEFGGEGDFLVVYEGLSSLGT